MSKETMTTTKLITDTQETTRTGTSGFTVTSIRTGNAVEVLIEFDIASREECNAMIGMLLAQLEELHGERFVANCIAHYAEETGKKFMQEGDHEIVMIRGRQQS